MRHSLPIVILISQVIFLVIALLANQSKPIRSFYYYSTMLQNILSLLLLNAATSQAHPVSPVDRAEHHETNVEHNVGGNCAFPHLPGMVAVQTSGLNGGWAMHDDQPCAPGTWCPYACPPGQVMAQWDPAATDYSYPLSQHGGLFCDPEGRLHTPMNGEPLCVDGAGSIVARNLAGSPVAMCQTVLPGNEEMLIPTEVGPGGTQTLAVPDPSYWASTAAHFYVNPPGVSVEDGCKWGTSALPHGNWAPYVAGANMAADGTTFTKVGWNPVYLEPGTPFKHVRPGFGVRVTCDDPSMCVGLPCSIDPTKQDVNEVEGPGSAGGAGGANFCVVGVKPGAKAHIEVFEV